MGTSKSFGGMKGNPKWPNFSRTVTSTCIGGHIPNSKVGGILAKYVGVIGGASRASSGKSRIAGRGGIKTARKLGNFLGLFVSSGNNLAAALGHTGLVDLEGKSASDVINHLIEYCSGPSVTLDDRAAKAASQMLLEEMASNADTVEELEENLKSVLDKYELEEIIVKYFGYYVLEDLSVLFYEKLVREKGKTKCSNLFRQIKSFIVERLKEVNTKNPIKKIKWGTSQSEKLVQKIYHDVLTVFADYED